MKISKILVVDDSESDQFLAKMEIEEYGDDIEIVEAYDGLEAFEKLEAMEVKPDVIFLDINMPRMNGLQFLEKYSKTSEQTAVVVMLTSSEQAKDRETAMQYDCVKDYFLKLLDENKMSKIASL